jgi:hypothetical protein
MECFESDSGVSGMVFVPERAAIHSVPGQQGNSEIPVYFLSPSAPTNYGRKPVPNRYFRAAVPVCSARSGTALAGWSQNSTSRERCNLAQNRRAIAPRNAFSRCKIECRRWLPGSGKHQRDHTVGIPTIVCTARTGSPASSGILGPVFAYQALA